MANNSVEKFYKELLGSKQFNEVFKNKLNNIHDETEYREFIRNELLPLAKQNGYEFNEDDVVAHDNSVIQSLSEEELESVAGGMNLKTMFVTPALMLLVKGGVTSAIKPANPVTPSDVSSASTTSGVPNASTSREKIASPQTNQQRRFSSPAQAAASSSVDSTPIAAPPVRSEIWTVPKIQEQMEKNKKASSTELDMIQKKMKDAQKENPEENTEVKELYNACQRAYEEYTLLHTKMEKLIHESSQWATFQSAFDEIQDIMQDHSVDKIKNYLKNPTAQESSVIFQAIQRRKKLLQLTPSTIQQAEAIIIRDLNQSTGMHKERMEIVSKSDDLSKMLQTFSAHMAERNNGLKQHIKEMSTITSPWEDLAKKLRAKNYSDLFKRWRMAYQRRVIEAKVTQQLQSFIDQFSQGRLDLEFMNELSNIRLQGFFSLYLPRKSLVIQQLDFEKLKAAPITLDHVNKALANMLTSRNIPSESIKIPFNVLSAAFARIEKIYTDLGNQLQQATDRLRTMPKCLRLGGTGAVVGDIHGYYYGLQNIISILQSKFDDGDLNFVIFTGDILDRGPSSTLALKTVLEFFNRNPGKVYILRGNHETLYKYKERGQDKFWLADAAIVRETGLHRNYDALINYFEALPIAAIVNNETFVVHGGIPGTECDSSLLKEKAAIPKEIQRNMVWSDFDETRTGTIKSPRGCGFIFGWDTLGSFFNSVHEQLPDVQLKHLVHGHSHVDGPFSHYAKSDMTVTTVISAPEFIDMYRQAYNFPNQRAPLNLPDIPRNHGSVVLVQKGKAPTEYAGFAYNRDEKDHSLMLSANMYAKSGIEILDIMLPIIPHRIANGTFAGSSINLIVVHDERSEKYLTDNRAALGIGAGVVIKLLSY